MERAWRVVETAMRIALARTGDTDQPSWIVNFVVKHIHALRRLDQSLPRLQEFKAAFPVGARLTDDLLGRVVEGNHR